MENKEQITNNKEESKPFPTLGVILLVLFGGTMMFAGYDCGHKTNQQPKELHHMYFTPIAFGVANDGITFKQFVETNRRYAIYYKFANDYFEGKRHLWTHYSIHSKFMQGKRYVIRVIDLSAGERQIPEQCFEVLTNDDNLDTYVHFNSSWWDGCTTYSE